MPYRIVRWLALFGVLIAALQPVAPLHLVHAAEPWHAELWAGLDFKPLARGAVYGVFRGQLFGRGQHFHVVIADRKLPTLSVQTTLAGGQVRGLEAVPGQADRIQTPQQRVIAAINGDFYYTGPVAGVPFGLHIAGHELITGPNGSPALGVLGDGRYVIGRPTLEAEARYISEDGTRLASASITDVNGFVVRDTTVLYTPAFGRTTPAISSGVWVIFDEIDRPLSPGGVSTGTVARVQLAAGSSVSIPPAGAVLGAMGHAEPFLLAATPGQRVEFAISLTPPFDEAVWALAGPNHIVTANQRASLDPRDSFVASRHPRTAVGFNEDAIFFVAVEGRRLPEAAGMSLFELADLLIALGATEAINLDGGGSTTLVTRRPGELGLSLVNQPSDGRVRPVANGLALVSRAPSGELEALQLEPPADWVWIGSRFRIDVKGLDTDFGPAPVPVERLEWTVEGDAVRLEADGMFVADQVGEARVIAVLGDITAERQIRVVDETPELWILPSTISVAVHQKAPLELGARSASGEAVWVGPERVRWRVDGQAASVSPAGELWGERIGQARVYAALREQVASASVVVTPAPTTVWAFDRLGPWRALATRAQATVSLTAEQALFGRMSARLEYDLTMGESGTAAAYLHADPPIPIAGNPSHLGMWIYGDGSGHWLRGQYVDALGTPHVLDFTPPQGLTWTGWKYVEAAFDPEATRPLALQRVYIAETDDAYKSRGRLYIDRIAAVYTDADASGLP